MLAEVLNFQGAKPILGMGSLSNIIFTIENPMSDSSEIDCNRLFDRFYTGDKSRHNGSTGLGLAVVKTLVAILGGNIVAKVHANSLIITLEL